MQIALTTTEKKTQAILRLVRAVSRSFYLTLRLLPGSVRSGITLAYLLARASDTIADSSQAALSMRLRALKFLQDFAVHREGDWDSEWGVSLAQFQENLAEKELLECLPVLMEKLKIHADREDICEVWSTILEGQIFDLEHSFAFPLCAEQLDRYAFLVAGCVGRFWTRLCFRKISRFASLPPQRMEELGIVYGKGLQLINILRDREEDNVRGRIYVSDEEVERRREEAWKAMQSGVEYAMAVNRPLLRYAIVLPALLGLSTLELIGLRRCGEIKIPSSREVTVSSGKVKISRAEVRRILIAALPCLWSSRSIAKLVGSFGFSGAS